MTCVCTRPLQALKTPPSLWVVGHIHEAYGEHSVLHESSGKRTVLINAATYYLTKGDGGAAPRVVLLPSQQVSQPAVGNSGASHNTTVWKRPQDPIVL